MKDALGRMMVATTLALLSACGGGGSSNGGSGGGGTPPIPATYGVGGAVSGLVGAGLQLQDNGTDMLAVAASGAFSFPGRLAAGAAYAVSVLEQPSGQTCTVANGSGAIAAADVTTIAVSCTDTPPPSLAVTGIVPADQAASAPRASPVTATFNRAVAPQSVASAVTISGPQGNAIAGKVGVSGATIQWTPTAGALPGGTTYGVTLAGTIQDASGSALGQPFGSHFTTAPQAWASSATPLAPRTSNTGGIRPIAMLAAPDGDMTALWYHDDLANAIDMARMSASTGAWGPAATVYTASGANGIMGVSAAIDGQGTITLAWQESSSSTVGTTAYLARIAADTGAFSTPENLPAVPAGVQAEQIVMGMNASGDMMVVSIGADGFYVVRRPAQASAWSMPVDIPAPYVGGNLEVTLDAVGDAVVAWVARPPTALGVIDAMYFDATSATWSAQTQVAPSVDIGLFNEFSMVTDATGATTIAWSAYNGLGGSDNIAVARRDPATGQWGAPMRVDQASTGAGAFFPGLAVDPSGVVTTAWIEFAAVKAARFDPVTSTWSDPVTIATGGSTDQPTLLADVAGNVTALIHLDNRLQATQYSITGGSWQAGVAIDAAANGTTVFSNPPVAAIDPSGTVAAVWFSEMSSLQSFTVANVFR